MAHYRDGANSWIQAAVWIDGMPNTAKRRQSQWWALLRDIMGRLVSATELEFAYRVSFQQGSLGRLLILTAQERHQNSLRAMLAHLRRLHEMIPGSFRECSDRAEHDRLAELLPPVRSYLLPEQYATDERLLVQDFRAFSLVDTLLASAVERGANFSLQVNTCHSRPEPIDFRTVRKNLARMEADRSTPPAIVQSQQRIVEQFAEPSLLVDQFLACDDEESLASIHQFLRDAYRESFGRLGFPDPQHEVAGSGELDHPLFTGFHSAWFAPPDVGKMLAMATPRRELLRLLSWQPAGWITRLFPDLATMGDPVNNRSDPSNASIGNTSVRVFISCKSADYPLARSVHQFLVQRGIATFFCEESLPKLGTSDYRRAIDACLDRAEHMVVVASSIEHVMSSWVEAEWGFFINEKRSNRKSGNVITVVSGNISPGDLPPALRYCEVVPLTDDGLAKLARYVM